MKIKFFERINLHYVLIGAFLGILSAFFGPSIIVPLAVASIGLVVGVYLIYFIETENPKVLINIFLGGFFIRFFICILLAYFSYIKRGHIFFLGADDYGFSLNATRIISAWKEAGYVFTPSSFKGLQMAGDLGYSYLVAFLYYFVGEYHLFPLFINVALSSLSIILFYLFVRTICGYRIAIISTAFFTFWPSLILWSTQNLKESITIFCILISFLCIEKLRHNLLKFGHWTIFLICLCLLFRIRITIAVFLAVSAFFSIFFFSKKKNILIGITGIVIAYFCLTNNLFQIQQAIEKRFGFDLNSSLNTLQRHHQVRTVSAESAFLSQADISKPLNFIFYLPLFLSYIFFSPFPWMISKTSQIFAGIEMLLWYGLAFFAIKGLFLIFRFRREKISSIFIFSLIVIIVSFGEGNIGTLFRHRALIWPCLFIFISEGISSFLPQ